MPTTATDSGIIETIAPDISIEGSGAVFSNLGAADTIRILHLSGWSVHESRPVQCIYRPGSSILVRRKAWATRDDAVRTFSVVSELRRESRRQLADHDGTDLVPVPLLDDHPRHRVWVFPFDPYLPDLAYALTIEGARQIAQSVVGFKCSVRSTVVVYRPTKRAVLRFLVRPRGRTDGEPIVLYVKVTLPELVDRVFAGARALEGSDPRFVLPTQRPKPGLIVYRATPGRSMRDRLVELRTSSKVPSPLDIWNIAETISAVEPHDLTEAPSPESRLDSALKRLGATVPHLDARLSALDSRIRPDITGRVGDPTLIHGDFHEGQILVDDSGVITGVLDIDDLAVGDLSMDAANFSAHLLTLSESFPRSAVVLKSYRRAFLAVLEEAGLGPADLAAREAVAVLQLATGPFRVMDPNWVSRTEGRVGLAESLLD